MSGACGKLVLEVHRRLQLVGAIGDRAPLGVLNAIFDQVSTELMRTNRAAIEEFIAECAVARELQQKSGGEDGDEGEGLEQGTPRGV